jgi:catalase
VRLSKAAVFRSGQVPVMGRLSLAGGEPYMPDGPAAVRSVALAFRPADGEEWRVAMIGIPVFVVKDLDGFYEQLLASRRDPATASRTPGNCRDVNFDPLVLSSGIEPSDDPLLSARSAAYSTSFTRRAGERKEPSAVRIPAGGKGV